MPIKALIFDLDGTLIDSLEDIALSMNEVLKELKLPTHSILAYKHFVGDGAMYLAQRVVPKQSSQELIEEVFTRYKELSNRFIYTSTQVYEGIYELLDILHNSTLHLGILSNKPHEFTLKYAQKFFAKYKFTQIHGQKEEVPKKPHPQGALSIALALNLLPEEILFVGDTPTDILTASNANMKSIGVLWGFRTKEELQEAGADFLAKHPQDIYTIINSLNQKIQI